MTLTQIRDILHGSEPFVIRVVSGQEYRVKHPDYAALGQDATLLFTDALRRGHPGVHDDHRAARARRRLYAHRSSRCDTHHLPLSDAAQLHADLDAVVLTGSIEENVSWGEAVALFVAVAVQPGAGYRYVTVEKLGRGVIRICPTVRSGKVSREQLAPFPPPAHLRTTPLPR